MAVVSRRNYIGRSIVLCWRKERHNVGDITIGYDPPRRGRVIPLAVHMMTRPMKMLKMAVHEAGLLKAQDLKAT